MVADPRVSKFTLWLMLLSPLLAGCTVFPPSMAAQTRALSPGQLQAIRQQQVDLRTRYQELDTRAGSLDTDNQRLQILLAQQQQQTAQLQDALHRSRKRSNNLRQQVAELQSTGPGIGTAEKVSADTATYRAGEDSLPLVKISGAEVSLDGDSIRIRLSGAKLFAAGSADIRSTHENNRLLDSVSAALRREYAGHHILVEGHTDSDPIQRSRWKSNLELSLVRARSVSEALLQREITEDRLSIAGFGADRPLAGNRTTKGKARNRRVEIVVSPVPSR